MEYGQPMMYLASHVHVPFINITQPAATQNKITSYEQKALRFKEAHFPSHSRRQMKKINMLTTLDSGGITLKNQQVHFINDIAW